MNSRLLTAAIAVALIGAVAQPSWGKSATTHAKRDGTIPSFNFEASCRAAVRTGMSIQSRTENACTQDEKAAEAKVEKEWREFSSSQKSLCLALENAGGMPSYVEFLTCLEMGKAVAGLPKGNGRQNADTIENGHPRIVHGHGRSETTGSAPNK